RLRRDAGARGPAVRGAGAAGLGDAPGLPRALARHGRPGRGHPRRGDVHAAERERGGDVDAGLRRRGARAGLGAGAAPGPGAGAAAARAAAAGGPHAAAGRARPALGRAERVVSAAVPGEAEAVAAMDAAGLAHAVTRHGRVSSLEEAAEARGVEPAAII